MQTRIATAGDFQSPGPGHGPAGPRLLFTQNQRVTFRVSRPGPGMSPQHRDCLALRLACHSLSATQALRLACHSLRLGALLRVRAHCGSGAPGSGRGRGSNGLMSENGLVHFLPDLRVMMPRTARRL